VSDVFRSMRQGARAFVRDLRAGELRLLGLSLVIAVAAMTSVGFFIDRLRGGLERDAAQLLGGDLVLVSDVPIRPEILSDAHAAGLRMAETVVFPSMALAVPDQATGSDPKAQLSSIKAASDDYPLRGNLRTAPAPGQADEAAHGVPERGTVWVDAALLPALDAQVGSSITLGDRAFRVARIVTLEPDRGLSFVNLAPRVLMRLDDLESTHLIQNGSRETHRLLVAGDAKAVAQFKTAAEARLGRGQRFESIESGRPDIRNTLDRAERFLALVALLTAMLAALAVAIAARRYTERHLDATAVMRCIGADQRAILITHISEFALIGLASAAVGITLGFVTHFVFVALLASLLDASLPAPSVWPAVQGFAIGAVLLAGFALPPVIQLRHVSPVRVIRRDVGLPKTSTAAAYLLGLAGFAVLALWSARDLKIGLITLGGFAAACIVFALVSYGVLKGLARLQRAARVQASWRFALASMQRRPQATVVQTVALAIGLMALILLSVTRTDLVAAWQRSVPPDAPNRFVINVQPDQREAFIATLRAGRLDAFDFAPMIRGRLISHNGKSVKGASFEDERAQRLADREFNLSYTDALPSHNRVVAGRWFAPGAADEISMEEGIAKTLHIELGDTLVFDIAGRQAEGKVTSLRKLDWDSMHVNFFVIYPTAALSSMAQTWISAFHLRDDQTALAAQLAQRFPNVTIIDTGALFRQVQSIVDRVVRAIEFLFLFTLVAGVLVLYAALLSSRDERTREAALLRALGASRRQLLRAQLAEFFGIGAIAGLLASAGATATGWALATQAFDLPYAPSAIAWVFGLAGGVALSMLGGWLGLRRVLDEPPLRSLREA